MYVCLNYILCSLDLQVINLFNVICFSLLGYSNLLLLSWFKFSKVFNTTYWWRRERSNLFARCSSLRWIWETEVFYSFSSESSGSKKCGKVLKKSISVFFQNKNFYFELFSNFSRHYCIKFLKRNKDYHTWWNGI